jgi:hypothetical protein
MADKLPSGWRGWASVLPLWACFFRDAGFSACESVRVQKDVNTPRQERKRE